MQLYQIFDVDVVPPTCNFNGNETLARVFSFEILTFLQPVTLVISEISTMVQSLKLQIFYILMIIGYNYGKTNAHFQK